MNVYEIITDRILEKLEQGTVPWHQPWSQEMPKNLVSKKAYRGINVFLLGSTGYANPYWLTFRQTKPLGGHIRRGEKSTPVIFWKIYKKDTGEVDKNGESIVRRMPVLRYYNTFNVQQCEGIPEDKIPPLENARDFHPIKEAEKTVQGMPQCPKIEYREARAFYRPSVDTVNMPQPEAFTSDEEFYSTLFHELTHSTGHQSRLGRLDTDNLAPFGSRDYSQEELVAEMGSAFLCGHCGIVDRIIDNSSAYIAGWLQRLRSDEKLIVIAAAQAQKAADFILNQGGHDHD
ncbi:zincin-like metallopeptidase domain-containing protein [Acidobacteria bacterium AH-259-A15]|nr:zincin-like metallopeptidase domain-containing protein [Acidobacteria bacterium AH-259-A15]